MKRPKGMTIKELIEALQDLPGDWSVKVSSDAEGNAIRALYEVVADKKGVILWPMD